MRSSVTDRARPGGRSRIRFEKQCTNYAFSPPDRKLLATVVTVAQSAGETFTDLETAAEPDDVDAAPGTARSADDRARGGHRASGLDKAAQGLPLSAVGEESRRRAGWTSLR